MIPNRSKPGRAAATLLALCVALLGAGCNGSSSSSPASLRLVNLTLTHPSVDLLDNSSVAASAVAADAVSSYTSPASGSNTLQVSDSGSTTALAALFPSLSSGAHYALLAYESGSSVVTALLGEDNAAPAANTAELRVYDLAADAGRLDVYVSDPSVDLATLTSPTQTVAAGSLSALVAYSPGTYRVRVTGAGNKADLRADIASVALASQQIATVVLTPTAGGVLLNGAALIQQASIAGTRNPNARVRLAAAVSGNATVAANASSGTGNIVIDSGSVAPAFGFYSLVPAASTLNISVNGQSVAAPASALEAGKDATLLVYGDPGTAAATLLADDNRLPTDTTAVKLRLINAITGSTGNLTLTANSALVAGGISVGAASPYVSVPGSSTAMDLTLTSSASPGVFLDDTAHVLSTHGVYTIMAGGAFASPQLLIR